MADWEYKSLYPMKITYEGPNTLAAKTDDEREIRRVISLDKARVFDETYRFDKAQMDDVLQFFDTYGTNLTFSRISWDPKAPDPSVDTATVRITKFSYEYYARNSYHAKIEMRENLT